MKYTGLNEIYSHYFNFRAGISPIAMPSSENDVTTTAPAHIFILSAIVTLPMILAPTPIITLFPIIGK